MLQHNYNSICSQTVIRDALANSSGLKQSILATVLVIERSEKLRDYAVSSEHSAVFTSRELAILARIIEGEGVSSLAREFSFSLSTMRAVLNKLDRKLLKVAGRVKEFYVLNKKMKNECSEVSRAAALALLKGIPLSGIGKGDKLSVGGITNVKDVISSSKAEILSLRGVGEITYKNFLSALSCKIDCCDPAFESSSLAVDLVKTWISNNKL